MQISELTRRTILTGMGTLGLRSLGTGAAAFGAATGSAADNVRGQSLGLDDPERNLTTYIRLRGDLAGGPVYDMALGDVLGMAPGEQARPLFKMFGAQRSDYRRVSALEFHVETRYVGMLVDLQTGRPLERWLNPYNEKQCEVPVTRYGPTPMRMLADAQMLAGTGPKQAPQATRPWFVIGDIVHMLDTIVSPVVPALRPDADLMTFSGSVKELADPGPTRVPSRLSFNAVEHWRDWMQMEQPGSLWWHVAGVKLASPREYPEDFRERVREFDPGFFAGDAT